ncbi:MAG: DUF4391 domain-containing protein [Xanthomonadaceae bacterium]|nr:DUF4391 domain-containing protein [Xanthomonadaceae bacterium]MDE2256547.1 DUF4391 domain-containing protein [Xanthomonadaceae bacterium]
MYRELLRCLIPLSARRGETLRDQLERLAQVRAAERKCAQLEAQLARAKQFNRKVEVNRALREKNLLLARLRASPCGRIGDWTLTVISISLI